MHQGLPALQTRLVSIERSKSQNWHQHHQWDGPSPKLDQHESSHSRAIHVVNDALLNVMECMP